LARGREPVHGLLMAQRKTLLIVDDDNDLRGALAEQLQLHEEFAVVQAETSDLT
jgi:DNA-binding NtrC family response regulator